MSEKAVFMFPGQGSQSVGMREPIKELLQDEPDLFAIADEITGANISKLIDEGPEEELTRTSNTQPALLTMGIAYSEIIKKKGYSPDIVMGHSLGEYAALVYGGVFSFEDGIRLVRKRGQLMEKAVKETPGKMAAVVGAPMDSLKDIIEECNKSGVVEITNFNSPIQVVLSGEESAIDHAMELVRERKTGRAIELNVSAPFHSSLMKPIAEEFRAFLNSFAFSPPAVQFIDNVTGSEESDPANIKEKLVQQLYKPVLWEQSVKSAFALDGKIFIESGPGNVLAGLVKRVAKGISIIVGEKLARS